MRPGDGSFNGINMHGLEVQWTCFDEKYDLWEPRIELPDVTIIMERRNWYCDRGRWGFWASSTDSRKVCIDFADGFPRYFFDLQRAIDEMYDWIEFRKLLTPKEDAEV